LSLIEIVALAVVVALGAVAACALAPPDTGRREEE
jgi:hypothetical protein